MDDVLIEDEGFVCADCGAEEGEEHAPGCVTARLDGIEDMLDLIVEMLARIEGALSLPAQEPGPKPDGTLLSSITGQPVTLAQWLEEQGIEKAAPAQGLASGGIDHDDAKALRTLALGQIGIDDTRDEATRSLAGDYLKQRADAQYTDDQSKLDQTGESTKPWWLRLR